MFRATTFTEAPLPTPVADKRLISQCHRAQTPSSCSRKSRTLKAWSTMQSLFAIRLAKSMRLFAGPSD